MDLIVAFTCLGMSRLHASRFVREVPKSVIRWVKTHPPHLQRICLHSRISFMDVESEVLPQRVTESEIHEYQLRMMRDGRFSLEDQVRLMHAFVRHAPDDEVHAALGSLWRIGMTDDQFYTFCSMCHAATMPRWEAAIELKLEPKISTDAPHVEKRKFHNRAAKALLRRLNDTIHFTDAEDEKTSRKGKFIQIPLIYFPTKTPEDIQRLHTLKQKITGKPSLQEEPVPGFRFNHPQIKTLPNKSLTFQQLKNSPNRGLQTAGKTGMTPE